jgi:hypothetical protein
MTRKYIPTGMLSAEALETRRAKERDRRRRQRASGTEHERAAERGRYAANRETVLAQKKIWRKANPESLRATKRKYREQSRARYIVQAVRGEAKQKGVKFDISVDWVARRLERGVCELSGLPFSDELRDIPSIDRRIPDGDYVEENCRLILFGLNSLLRRSGDAGVPRAVARIHELRLG